MMYEELGVITNDESDDRGLDLNGYAAWYDQHIISYRFISYKYLEDNKV